MYEPPLAAGYRNKTVLVVIEQPSIRELISLNLRDGGFFPLLATDRREAEQVISQVVPDALVIDGDSETIDGAFFTKELRLFDGERRLPTMMLTASLATTCGAGGGDCVADDCMAKPFSPQDLVGRMVALLRRTLRPSEPALKIGPLALYPGRHEVCFEQGGVVQHLPISATEFRLLQYLMAYPDRIHTREHLLAKVWGTQTEVDARTVDANIKRLRDWLRHVDMRDAICTVRGFGYRFDCGRFLDRPHGAPLERRTVATATPTTSRLS